MDSGPEIKAPPEFSGSTFGSSAAGWLLRGACLAGIVLLPFGPLGFCAGFICGGAITVVCGVLVDLYRFKHKKRQATKTKKKFEHLIRWTDFIFGDAENQTSLMLYLIKEFEAITMTQEYAASSSSLPKRLRDFLERNDVQSCMNEYLQCFFGSWRDSTPQEIATFETVLTVCTEAFRAEKRVPPPYRRMVEYRRSDAVRQLLLSAGQERQEMRGQADRRADLLSYVEYDDRHKGFRHEFKQHFGPIKKVRVGESEGSENEAFNEEEGYHSVPLTSSVSVLKGKLQLPVAIPHPYLHDGTACPEVTRTRSGSYRSLESIEGSRHRTVSVPIKSTLGRSFTGTLEPNLDPSSSLSEQMAAAATLTASQPKSPLTSFQEKPSSQRYSHKITAGLDVPTSSLSSADGILFTDREKTASVELSPSSLRYASPRVPQGTGVLSPIKSVGKLEDLGGSSDNEIPIGPTPPAETIDIQQQRVGSAEVQGSLPSVGPKTASPGPVVKMESTECGELQARKSGRKISSKGGRVVLPDDAGIAKQASRERFFKSLEDLREFAPELKHKIPIGLYEFEFLDDLYPETPLGQWEAVGSRNNVRVYKRIVTVHQSDLVMVKGYCDFSNIRAETILHNIRDTPRRSAWDKTFDGFVLVEGNIQNNEIVFNGIKAPWPVADRQFLQWRRTVIDDQTGVVKILHRSAEHPRYPPPKGGNVIRAESLISAYIITPTGPNSCQLFLVTQTDIKGIVPRWLVNSTAAKAPIGWVESLRAACLETQRTMRTIPPYKPRPQYLNGQPFSASAQ